jgi:uncharacterized protein (UPF0212 family)
VCVVGGGVVLRELVDGALIFLDSASIVAHEESSDDAVNIGVSILVSQGNDCNVRRP